MNKFKIGKVTVGQLLNSFNKFPHDLHKAVRALRDWISEPGIIITKPTIRNTRGLNKRHL